MYKIIIFEDIQTEIEIDVNADHLSSRSIFFRNLFSNSYRDNQQDKIRIQIRNAQIASDIVAGDEKDYDWAYIREKIICKQYFGIEQDLSFLANYIIDYKEILGLFDYFGYHSDLVASLCYNLSNEYDINDFLPHLNLSIALKKFPREKYIIACILIKYKPDHNLLPVDYQVFNIYEHINDGIVLRKEIILSYTGDYDLVGLKMLCYQSMFIIYDLWERMIVQEIDYNHNPIYFKWYKGNSILICTKDRIDIIDRGLIWEDKIEMPIANDDKYLAYTCNGYIKILDIDGAKIIFEKKVKNVVEYMLSGNGLVGIIDYDTISLDYNTITIIDILSDNTLRKFICKYSTGLSFSLNNQLFATRSRRNLVIGKIFSSDIIYNKTVGNIFGIQFIDDENIIYHKHNGFVYVLNIMTGKRCRFITDQDIVDVIYYDTLPPNIKKLVRKINNHN